MSNDLLQKAKSIVEQYPKIGKRRLSQQLGCGQQTARTLLLKIRAPDDIIPSSPEPKEGVELTIGKSSAYAQSTTRTIKTVEDLIAHLQIDMTKWRVSKVRAKAWESVMREPATTVGGAGDKALISEGKNGEKSTLWTRASNKPLHEPLHHVEAWFEPKEPHITATESLLEDIKKHSPILCVPRIRKLNLPHRRSLELCIMDPHIGLLCDQPEADAPQDLESAASLFMTAIDDLIERTKCFGPFEEVVAPFGNDFVHSDTVDHTTTAGTPQPESIAWHKVYDVAERVAIEMVMRLREVAKRVYIYEIPGNHSRLTDFTLARLLRARFHSDKNVHVDASSSPYKFHRFGVNLIGFEHGHSVKPIRLAALMANERRKDWAETEYREFHLGDQHRKGSSKPSMLEEQGVSVEYIPGLTAPNEWHRLKSFSHQKRGAMAFVWDYSAGPIGRFQFNISQYNHKPLK